MKRAVLYLYFSLFLLLPGFVFGQQTRAAPAHTSVSATAPSAEQLWSDLMAGNQRFMTGHLKTGDIVGLRRDLAGGQHPNVMVLACSDSRVAPELLFDKSLGDLFVVRSAGNIADAIGIGSIEYAAEHLGSSLLVVLGHEKCGAVSAACSQEKMPTVNLQAIVDQISPAVTRAKGHVAADQLLQAAIEENVHQSAQDVIANSPVLKHLEEEGKLAVIEAVYKLDSGEVVRLSKPVSSSH